MQTGFMRNRYIAQNIIQLTNSIHHCQKRGISAVLMSFDFHRAFDSIEWEAIRKAMEKFNFGPFFTEAVMTIS